MERKKLLILHGWGSSSLRWRKVKEILEEKGIEVFVPDLPGFGKTPLPRKNWHFLDYRDWAVEKVKEKGWERFNLLGHSFGGGVAVMIASKYPALIEKLILCSPAIIRKKSLKSFAFYIVARTGKKIFYLPGMRYFLPWARWAIYKLCRGKDYYLAEGEMKRIMKEAISTDLSFCLDKIEAKTLIIWGKKDKTLPLKQAFYLKEKIKNSKVVVIEKAGHNFCLLYTSPSPRDRG